MLSIGNILHVCLMSFVKADLGHFVLLVDGGWRFCVVDCLVWVGFCSVDYFGVVGCLCYGGLVSICVASISTLFAQFCV